MVRDDSHAQADLWSNWLLHDRQADDPHYGAVIRTRIAGYVDRLLDAARLGPGMTLADVGAGEGVVGLRALDRWGSELQCVFTDISRPMLEFTEVLAAQRGYGSQCAFHLCGADQLTPVTDASIDVVATRAALAYVADKPKALREFLRVLKPGGRISLCEPVMQDEAFSARALRQRIEGPRGAANHFWVLMHRWKAAQFPDTEEARVKNPLTNYSERDLVHFARQCGFVNIHVQLEIDVMPSPIRSWDVFIGISPHPWAPSLRQILAEKFTAADRELLERMVRPIVESGNNIVTERVVYMSAEKPPH